MFLRQDALGEAAKTKLGPHWHPEPLKVSERVGANSYRLCMPKAWRLHPVVSVAKLKPAGDLRPAPIGEPGSRPGATVRASQVHREGSQRRLKVSLVGRARPVLAQTAWREAGFEPLRAHSLSEARRPLPDYLGRLVRKDFVDTEGTGELKPFDGVVIAYDADDPARQFEVLYEDGDVEWLPASSLQGLLVRGGPRASDEDRLDLLRAEARRQSSAAVD